MAPADPRTVATQIRTRRGDQPLLLLCDFDGTLCEFRPDPTEVWLPEPRRDLLERIAGRHGVTVGIVSGRRLDDVRARTSLAADGVFVAGLHGLEIEGPGEHFVHPEIGDARSRAQAIGSALQPEIAAMPGVHIEDKDLSVALHYREASPEDQRRAGDIFSRTVAGWLSAGQIRVMRGACVLEALPNIAWNKGSAVDWIRQRVTRLAAAPFVVYMGDDITDEDAFRAVKGHGLSVACSDRVTGADHAVDGPPAVEQILDVLSR
jgi:trehalose-phosphatase